MTAQRTISAVLVLVSVVVCVMTGVALFRLLPQARGDYEPVMGLVLFFVLGCGLVAVVLTIVLAVRAASPMRDVRTVPRLVSAMSVVLGLLSGVCIASAILLLFYLGGDRSIGGMLSTVSFAAMALVSAAMMMIAANFRALLDKYRRADSELSRVI